MRERDIADWICTYPDTLLDELEIIGREVVLEHGRLDLLGWYPCGTQVIELKTGALKERNVGQVLRYRQDVCTELRTIGAWEYPLHCPNDGYEEKPEDTRFRHAWNWHHALSAESESNPSVQAVLVGASIDSYVLAAASGANIMIMLWRYRDGEFHFKHIMPGDFFKASGKAAERWAYAISDKATQECIKVTLDR